MNAKRNWIKVIAFVVLALASLSSVAMSAPHRDRPRVYIYPEIPGVCGANGPGHFAQYSAAIAWAEEGGDLPLALSVNCVEAGLNNGLASVDYAGESGDRFR
jgi:hypothetical protein